MIEAVPEKLALKHDVLGRAAKGAAENAILGTNTSSLSIDAIAEWRVSNQRLLIRATSSFGGRSAIEAIGLEPLVWDPDELAFTGNLTNLAGPPATVTLQTSRGAVATLPVTVVP